MKLSSLMICLGMVSIATSVVLAMSDSKQMETGEERRQMIQDAIDSVKSSCKFGNCVETAQTNRAVRKQPSVMGRRLGQSQLMYEQMVRTAERSISERRRQSIPSSNENERAESIASELLHKPGTLLTQQEIGQMWEASGCEEIRPPPTCQFIDVNRFRTIDGTCNNLDNPLFGASSTAFSRLTLPEYEDGISSPRGALQGLSVFGRGPFQPPNPSARLISLSVIQDIRNPELPFSHLLMQWGQFLDHDFTLSPFSEGECVGCQVSEVCNPIRVPRGDPAFGIGTPNNANCLPTQRSLPVCELERPLSFNPREQINELTSFIDASMVYGSEERVANAVRAFSGGLLRVGPNFPANQPSLPVDEMDLVDCPGQDNCFLCGDARCNEQFSLTILHTLWLREHNRCAKELAQINPHWDDKRLFLECRAIVGALVQKITYVDYLPIIFGNSVFNRFVGPYSSYDPRVDPSIPNSFGAAAFRYGHTLIRPQFDRIGANNRALPIGPLNLADAFFSPDQFRVGLGTDPIVRGWLSRNSLRVDEFLTTALTTQLLTTRIPPGFDLAALNIHRGRDHGLAPYPVWKNFCTNIFGLSSEFENSITLARFMRLYGDTIDTLDLWIGGLAEGRLRGSLLGATFACLFGLTFQNVRNGDRFFYENPGVFTPAQLAEIQSGSLSRVICDNSDNINVIQRDAFVVTPSRVACSQLPRVDLSKWKEDVFYARVRVNPTRFNSDVSSFSISVTPKFVLANITIPASTRSQSRCLQAQLPINGNPTDTIIFSRGRSPTISANPNLPADRSSSPGVYRSTITQQTVNSPNNGLFSTLDQCLSSSRLAFIMSFPQQEVEVQIEKVEAKMEKFETQTEEADLMEIVELQMEEEKIPDEVMEVLKSERDGVSSRVEEVDKKSKESKQQDISSEDLMKELEDLLSDS